MAEPSKAFSQKMVEVFLSAYNLENGTNYKWIDGKSNQPEGKPYYDFLVFDGVKELGIQHTRAVADPIREFVRPKAANKVIEPLRKMLEENSELPSLSIYINFHNPPATKDEEDEAIYWLEYFISSKASSSHRTSYFTYDASFDDQFLPRILKYVDDINIKPHPDKGDKKIISFTYGWSKKKPEPWLNDAQRVINAVEKKALAAKDTILLVESGWSGVYDFYQKMIKEELSKKDLKEVWIIELFLGAEKAYRVK